MVIPGCPDRASFNSAAGSTIPDWNSAGPWRWELTRRGRANFSGCPGDAQESNVILRAGFSIFPATEELELGFIFKRQYWGSGYATEAAQSLLSWLFQSRPDIDHAIALAYADNRASIRVLEKIGMRPTGERTVDGVKCTFYRADRE